MHSEDGAATSTVVLPRRRGIRTMRHAITGLRHAITRQTRALLQRRAFCPSARCFSTLSSQRGRNPCPADNKRANHNEVAQMPAKFWCYRKPSMFAPTICIPHRRQLSFKYQTQSMCNLFDVNASVDEREEGGYGIVPRQTPLQAPPPSSLPSPQQRRLQHRHQDII